MLRCYTVIKYLITILIIDAYLDGISWQRHEKAGFVGIIHHGDVGPEIVEVLLQTGNVLGRDRLASLDFRI